MIPSTLVETVSLNYEDFKHSFLYYYYFLFSSYDAIYPSGDRISIIHQFVNYNNYFPVMMPSTLVETVSL